MKLQEKIINADYIKLLSEAGFPKITPDYAIITEEAISDYIIDLLLKYHPYRKRTAFYVHKKENRLMAELKEFSRVNEDIIIEWKETLISQFSCTPPRSVLEAIIKAKDKFDELYIVTVTDVNEFFVIGKNKFSNFRYLIDRWDQNLTIEDINKDGKNI